MQIRDLNPSSPAGHKVLYAMDNMCVVITLRTGEPVRGILSVPFAPRSYVMIDPEDSLESTRRISRDDVIAVDFVAEF